MRSYALLNKRLNRKLIHPRVGLWFTPSLEEARETLKACHEYLEAIGAKDQIPDFVIIDAETSEEILG